VEKHRLTTLAVDSVGNALLPFITLEFFCYWLHRAGHRVRRFWCNHAVHHTPNQLNLGASLRIGMFGKLTGNVIFLLPLVWIGFDLRLMLGALSLNLLYQFWIHATWIPKLGRLEYVLNTPSAHRVHRAANPLQWNVTGQPRQDLPTTGIDPEETSTTLIRAPQSCQSNPHTGTRRRPRRAAASGGCMRTDSLPRSRAHAAGPSRPTDTRRWARRCICASTTCPASTQLQQQPDLLRERQRSLSKRIYARPVRPRTHLGIADPDAAPRHRR
jgi:hypothetical protein